MVGEYLGRVMAVESRSFVLDTPQSLHSGDGLCWFDARHNLAGTTVNTAYPAGQGGGSVRITPADMGGIGKGLQIYRNRDHVFLKQVERGQPTRRIAVRLRLKDAPVGFELQAEDEDANRAVYGLTTDKAPAKQAGRAEATARRQLSKTGGSVFACTAVELVWDRPYFLPVGVLNALRRETLERLSAEREANRPLMAGGHVRNDVPFPESRLTFRANALNEKAVAFYRRHGVGEIAPAAESGLDMQGEVVMRTRYCIKHQLGFCDGRRKGRDLREPLYLVDTDGHRYRLRFKCDECEMEVIN
jgi:putative protease